MKTFLLLSITTVVSLGRLAAGDVVTAGTIQSFSKDGTLEVLPQNRAKTTLIYRNIQAVPVFYSTGSRAPLWELQSGRKAMIHYKPAGKRWVVAKVSLAVPAPPPPPGGNAPGSFDLPGGERHAMHSKAARDRDVTTQPGSKATIDRDITTQPGTKAARDRDITTKPPGVANYDRDITTHSDRR